MSAFIVSEDCMTNAVRALLWKHGQCGYDSDEGTQLGRDLFALNCQAVNARYPNHQAENPEDYADYEFGTPARDNPAQWLKSLQCLLYQCSEGDIPEKSNLYARLQKKECELMGELVSRIKAYELAAWG